MRKKLINNINNRILISIFILCINNIARVESSGKVAIKLVSFSNPLDYDYDGVCCNGDLILLSNKPQCSKACNTLITLCLDYFQSNSDFNVCPFGSRNLSAINDQSSIVFSIPIAGDVENPVLMQFNNNYQVVISISINSMKISINFE
jgi:hypothetical protein